MTEYVLPFTCKQAIEVLKIMKYCVLVIAPIMLLHAIITGQYSSAQNQDMTKYPIFLLGLFGTMLSWMPQIIWAVITLAEQNRLPSFRCKCESDNIPSKEDRKE